MNTPQEATAAWPQYTVQTHNISHRTDTSIHTDKVAQSFGFKGALVAGRAVYSHLLHPLLARYGESFLSRGRNEVRFLKPAYEGDTITVRVQPAPEAVHPRHLVALATNQQQVELARLEADCPEPFPEPHPHGALAPPEFTGTRVDGEWERLALHVPLPAYHWQPAKAEQEAWCDSIGEDLALFRAGDAPPLHPGLVPSATTAMLHQNLVVKGWVHASSVFVAHRLLRVGMALELRTTPLEKHERKGRKFLTLHVAIMADGVVAAEEYRTAIVNLGAGR